MSRACWYALATSPATAVPVVRVYSEIGRGGVMAAAFLADLGDAPEVEVRINSSGGDPFEAMAIYSNLCRRRKVSVTVDGLCASAATIIAMAASPGRLSMMPGSMLMVHDAWLSGAAGNAASLRADADVLDTLSGQIAGIYAVRTGKQSGYWRAVMERETWYTADEAVAAGLADSVAADPFRARVAAIVRETAREVLYG